MKYAFSTQSYRGDFEECKLLCESLDRFAPGVEHFIFVNDEDWDMFQALSYGQHILKKKSKCIPWFFFRFPFKLRDHYFWLSPFTFPMRGWIYQQVCKLAVFDVIGDDYDFVINLDSEAILIKPFDLSSICRDGKFKLFRDTNTQWDTHQGLYTDAIQKFFKGTFPQKELDKYQYMDIATVFDRRNLQSMLSEIKSNSPYGSWKLWMANTLKFSEFFTYGNYVVHKLNGGNHYLTEESTVRWIEYKKHLDKNEMNEILDAYEKDPNVNFLWVQKVRHVEGQSETFFGELKDYFYDRWK